LKYTVERLHKIKEEHERWAQETFGEPDINAGRTIDRQVGVLKDLSVIR